MNTHSVNSVYSVVKNPSVPSATSADDPTEDLFGPEAYWDAHGTPFAIGATVIRYRDSYRLQGKLPTLALIQSLNIDHGTVQSIYPPRCHVSWHSDPIGTRPHICRLVQIPTEPTK